MSGLLMLLHWVFVPMVVEGTEQYQMMHTGQTGHWQQESVSSAGFSKKRRSELRTRASGKDCCAWCACSHSGSARQECVRPPSRTAALFNPTAVKNKKKTQALAHSNTTAGLFRLSSAITTHNF